MKLAAKFAARNASDNDDNMVPLINVVFLMLVFFMVAGQIKKADPVAVIPPTSINDTRANSEPNAVIVVSNDELYLDDQPVVMEDIQSLLETSFSAAENQADYWVQVKADGGIAIDQLRPIFNQIRLAGLVKVSLATQLEREQP
ncbi:ExbD/TolR family protein [Marinomonas dokdonensis]|uniref:ExbD/TolR family protein n=1 Tax=Marinomonas dokdonensis TaxID=328224 RepID=UPI00405545F7